MPPVFGVRRECDKLVTVLVKRPQEALGDQYLINTKWEKEMWLKQPDFNRSSQEHFNVCRELKTCDVSLRYLPSEWVISMNSLFTRDSAIVTPLGGFIKCVLTELGRFDEPSECGEYLDQLGLKLIGEIESPALCSGSDFIWLSPKLLLATLSSQTNAEAIVQVRKILDENDMKDVEILSTDIIEKGQREGSNDAMRATLHSALSPVAAETLVICPEKFEPGILEELRKREFKLISVSIPEWEGGAAEILMVGPKKALVAGISVEDEILQRIKRTLLEDMSIDVKIMACPNLRLSRGGLKSMTLPLYRQGNI